MTSDAFRTCRSTGTSCAQCARLGVLVGGDTLPVWPRMQVLTTALISLTGALGVVGGDTLPDLPRGAAGRAASARVRACMCSQRRPPPPHSRRICTGVGTSSASCAHASAHDGAHLPTGHVSSTPRLGRWAALGRERLVSGLVAQGSREGAAGRVPRAAWAAVPGDDDGEGGWRSTSTTGGVRSAGTRGARGGSARPRTASVWRCRREDVHHTRDATESCSTNANVTEPFVATFQEK